MIQKDYQTLKQIKLFLHPPSEVELDELENLYKNKEYEDAFYLVEEILEVSPFWIDGHLYSYNILEKTKNYDEAKEVKNTLLSFLKTNEGILNLCFIDNTPFASKKAKKWIDEELINSNSSDNTVQEKVVNDNEEILSVIHELANDNKIKEAMNLLNQKYYSSSNTEENLIGGYIMQNSQLNLIKRNCISIIRRVRKRYRKISFKRMESKTCIKSL